MSPKAPMAGLNFDLMKAYAVERLASELPDTMYYHSLAHTRDEVVPAAEHLAHQEGVTGVDLILLLTAAYFHDLGFVEQSLDHEAISARMAKEALPKFGYNPDQISVITSIIMATKLPQSPHTILEQIMADADLDVLGRCDYMSRNQALREELAAHGNLMSDEQWYSRQLKFLQAHQYFTQAARNLRGPKKQQNMSMLVELLAQMKA
jgi:uncharacterized protein